MEYFSNLFTHVHSRKNPHREHFREGITLCSVLSAQRSEGSLLSYFCCHLQRNCVLSWTRWTLNELYSAEGLFTFSFWSKSIGIVFVDYSSKTKESSEVKQQNVFTFIHLRKRTGNDSLINSQCTRQTRLLTGCHYVSFNCGLVAFYVRSHSGSVLWLRPSVQHK